jgi:hypothetical protein
MCRGRPGCSHFVLDRMKQQAPVWREIYRAPAGAKRARWWVDGKLGNRPDCPLNQKRSPRAYVTESRRAAPSEPSGLFTSRPLETNQELEFP